MYICIYANMYICIYITCARRKAGSARLARLYVTPPASVLVLCTSKARKRRLAFRWHYHLRASAFASRSSHPRLRSTFSQSVSV